MPESSNRFDALRTASPELALGVYALEPGGSVTLELITPEGRMFQFTAPTLEEAIDMAFPPAPDPEPQPDIFD